MDNRDTDKENEAECEHMLRNGRMGVKDESSMKELEKEDKVLPIDRDWAWAVLAGVALYLFLFGAVRKNFGLFFVAFQEQYNTNASVTSLVATIQNAIISISSFLIMTIGMHYMSNRTSILIGGVIKDSSHSYSSAVNWSLLIMTIGMHYMSNRTAILIGGVIKTVATVIAALSTDVRVLFFSIGILDGVGISFAQNPVISMLGEYFLKKRGFANGLAFCAASAGALVFAPILTTLFESHGYVGTMLIAAGMSFNCLVTGVLLRPISSFEKRRKFPNVESDKKVVANALPSENDDQIEKLITKEVSITVQNGEIDPPFRSLEIIPKHIAELRNEQKALYRMNSSDPVNESGIKQRRIRTISDSSNTSKLSNLIKTISNSKVAIFASSQGIAGSVISVIGDVERALSKTDNLETLTDNGCYLFKQKTLSVLKIIFDVNLFKTDVFPCILVLGFMMVSGGDCVLIMLPPHAKGIGLSNSQRGILMLLFACCDLLSRIILTIIGDRPFIKRTTLLVFAASILGLSCHLLVFFKTFGAMVVFSIITGCCSQLYWALHALILVDYLSLDKLRSSLGFMTLCHGISIAVVLPIAGALRDRTGTYIATYHVLGTLLFMGAATAFIIPHVDRRMNKKIEQ